MSANLVFRNYIPPGDSLNPLRPYRRAVSMAAAYSRRWNPRRLESPFYGVWNDLLSSMLDDEVALSLIPQLLIFRRRSTSSQPINDDRSVRTQAEKRGNTDELIPDVSFALVACELRNPPPINMNSPPLANLFVNPPNNVNSPNPNANQPIIYANPPTGSISDNPIPDWDQFRIIFSMILALAELKRPVNRDIESADVFVHKLDSNLFLAMSDVEGQAALFFSSQVYTKHDEVILFAISGEWYRWKLAVRKDYPLPKNPRKGWPNKYYKNVEAKKLKLVRAAERLVAQNAGESHTSDSDDDDNDSKREISDEEEEEEEEEENNHPRKSPSNDTNEDNSENSTNNDNDDGEDDNNDRPINRFLGITGPKFATEVDNIADAWPEPGGWSGFLRLGSQASNQRLFLIDRFLRNAVSNAHLPPRP